MRDPHAGGDGLAAFRSGQDLEPAGWIRETASVGIGIRPEGTGLMRLHGRKMAESMDPVARDGRGARGMLRGCVVPLRASPQARQDCSGRLYRSRPSV